jgi:hypothetical protein
MNTKEATSSKRHMKDNNGSSNFIGRLFANFKTTTSTQPFKEYPVDLSKYKQRLQHKRTSGSNEPEPNGSPEHSVIQISEMLLGSKDNFYIYDRDLSGDLLERTNHVNLLDDISYFIKANKNRRIEIIVDPDTRTDEKWLSKLREIGDNRIEVFRLDTKRLPSGKTIDDVPYFVVNDNKGYRQEDRNEEMLREAFCNFNNEIKSKKFIEIFNVLKEISSPI